MRVAGGTGSLIYSGNPFCLACHGQVDRQFSPFYYLNTAGSHENPQAVHYDANKNSLQPVSGTRITCDKCHDRHAATNKPLLPGKEEVTCYNCHNTGANSMNNRNIQAEFSRPGSRHDITGSLGAKVECSSCHGPHTVSGVALSAGQNISDLSDPDNTKRVMGQVYGTNTTIEDMTGFCLKCHDGNPPAAVNTLEVKVPYTVVFPNYNFSTNPSGWDKSVYSKSGHYRSGIQCDACHEPHGSGYYRLTSQPEDTAALDGICLRCHNGNNPAYPAAKNIKADLLKGTGSNYRHPSLDYSGRHLDTESYNNRPLTDRHAECVDCHDPHGADASAATALYPAGPIKNVSGVQVSFGTRQWSTWQTPRLPSPSLRL